MDVSRPLDVVTATLDAEVLTVLVLPPGRELTTGDVQRLVERRFGERRSIPGLRRTLERLAGQGVVRVRHAGRTGVYWFNDEHLAAEHIIGLATVRARLLRRLEVEVSRWPAPPTCGVLLEDRSVAGVEAPTIPILLLAPWRSDGEERERLLWDALVDELADRVETWTGAPAVVQTIAADRLDGDAEEALLRLARRGGEVFVGSLPSVGGRR